MISKAFDGANMFATLESQPTKPALFTTSQSLLEGRLFSLEEPHWLVIQTPECLSETKSTDTMVENSDSDLYSNNNNIEDEDEIPLIKLLERMKGRSSIAGGISVNELNDADSERAQELMGNPWGVELELISETQGTFNQESCQELEEIVERGRPRLNSRERELPRETRNRYRGRMESRGGCDRDTDGRTSPRQVKTIRSSRPGKTSNTSIPVGSSESSSITSCSNAIGIRHSPHTPRPVHDNDCLKGNTQPEPEALHRQNCRRERSMMSLCRSNLPSLPARFPVNACMTCVPYLSNCGSDAGLTNQSVRGGPWKAIRAHMESIPAFPEPKLLDIREAIILDRQRRMPWLYRVGNRPATEFPDGWDLKTYNS